MRKEDAVMDDLIRRQDAINELSYCQTYLFDSRDHDKKISLEDAEYTIERLPSAQQWIPCSERMPECDYTDVLICVYDKRKGCEKDYYIISAYTSGKHWEPTLAVDMTDLDVVAWMPLPEPYKGDDNG